MDTVEASGFEIVAEGYHFIEAPRAARDGAVWFSDLTGGGVHRKRPGREAEVMVPGRQWVGGMVFDETGHVLCGGRGGVIAVDPATGETCMVLDRLEGEAVIAVNDMEGDGRGGFFAGTVDFVSIMEKGESPRLGSLFHMAADGAVTVLRRDVFASNGLALSPCGAWLYHSETSRGIWRYPLGADGLPRDGELLVEAADSDGLAADSAGNLWLACWESGVLKHYGPDGALLQALTFPYPHIVSVAFGEDDPSSLVIATGGNADHPQAGAVLRMKVPVPGLPGARTRLCIF